MDMAVHMVVVAMAAPTAVLAMGVGGTAAQRTAAAYMVAVDMVPAACMAVAQCMADQLAVPCMAAATAEVMAAIMVLGMEQVL